MPDRNLISLLKASGEAGTDGQSFRMVDGAGDGIRMTDYLVGNLVIDGTLPVNETELPGAYNSGANFPLINIGIGSYGAQAHQIRRAGTTGFVLGLNNGGGGAQLQINSFTEAAPNDFDLDLTIVGKVGSNLNIQGAAVDSEPVPLNWGEPWYWEFLAMINSASGSDTMGLTITYTHDTGGFNTVKSAGPYNFTMNRREPAYSDLRYRWFDNSTDANANTNPVKEGNGSFYASLDAVSYGPNHPNNENFTVYLRFTADLTGSSGWSSVIGPTSITGDNRMEA